MPDLHRSQSPAADCARTVIPSADSLSPPRPRPPLGIVQVHCGCGRGPAARLLPRDDKLRRDDERRPTVVHRAVSVSLLPPLSSLPLHPLPFRPPSLLLSNPPSALLSSPRTFFPLSIPCATDPTNTHHRNSSPLPHPYRSSNSPYCKSYVDGPPCRSAARKVHHCRPRASYDPPVSCQVPRYALVACLSRPLDRSPPLLLCLPSYAAAPRPPTIPPIPPSFQSPRCPAP